MAITSRPSKSNDEIVVEMPVNSTGAVMHLRMTLENSRALRRTLESSEREIEKRMSARGEHPIY